MSLDSQLFADHFEYQRAYHRSNKKNLKNILLLQHSQPTCIVWLYTPSPGLLPACSAALRWSYYFRPFPLLPAPWLKTFENVLEVPHSCVVCALFPFFPQNANSYFTETERDIVQSCSVLATEDQHMHGIHAHAQPTTTNIWWGRNERR